MSELPESSPASELRRGLARPSSDDADTTLDVDRPRHQPSLEPAPRHQPSLDDPDDPFGGP